MKVKKLTLPPIDIRLSFEGRRARFTNLLDGETEAFEKTLSRGISLSLFQSHAYLAATRREFRLLQLWDASGCPSMQIAIYIHRPARLVRFAKAFAPKMAQALNTEDEACSLRLVRKLCEEAGDIITLTLQPIRSELKDLDSFESCARLAGFSAAPPVEYTRTLRFNTRVSADELPLQMSRKTRTKFRHRTRGEIDLRALTDPKYIPQCRAALRASFERTGGDPNEYDFEAAFEIAARQPDRIRIFGIFLPSRPELLLAFVIGHYGGGDFAEYTAAGSLPDPELRKMPFNYFLVWELIQWAHRSGAKWLDLGGITPGGENDPRASISEFKRHLSEDEIEIGREMAVTLQPLRALLFDTLNKVRLASRAKATRLAVGMGTAVMMFAAIACALKLAGNPESPAQAELRSLGHSPAIAVIGDSRAHVGISPKTLTLTLKKLGLPELESYNFAVDGTDVLHHYSFVAHSLADEAVPPRVVVWTPNPLQFNEVRQNNRLEQLVPGDIPAMYRSGAPLEMLFDLATMAIFPPYRERPLVKHALFEDYAGRAEIRSLPVQKRLLRLEIENEPLSREYHAAGDGQVPFRVLTWKDRFDRGAQVYLKDYEALTLSEWHFQLARELMRQVRQSGALLVMVETPVAPFFQKRLAVNPKHLEWRARMRKLAQEEDALFWSHADHYNDDRLFGDPGHMPESTAQDYSRFLAAQLASDGLVRSALEKQRRM